MNSRKEHLEIERLVCEQKHCNLYSLFFCYLLPEGVFPIRSVIFSTLAIIFSLIHSFVIIYDYYVKNDLFFPLCQ